MNSQRVSAAHLANDGTNQATPDRDDASDPLQSVNEVELLYVRDYRPMPRIEQRSTFHFYPSRFKLASYLILSDEFQSFPRHIR